VGQVGDAREAALRFFFITFEEAYHSNSVSERGSGKQRVLSAAPLEDNSQTIVAC
jgi:hypothetical protein